MFTQNLKICGFTSKSLENAEKVEMLRWLEKWIPHTVLFIEL